MTPLRQFLSMFNTCIYVFFLQFHCDPLQVKNVSKEIEAHDLEVTSAESEFIPVHWVSLQEPELSMAQKLYEKLSDHEDVTKVFDNVSVPEE